METASQDALRRRMRLRLKQLRMAVKDVAPKTGDKEKNVYNWLSYGVQIPADFVARFALALPVDPAWLLTGEGGPEPRDPDEAVQRLRAVRVALELPVLTLDDLLRLGHDEDVDLGGGDDETNEG